jgi:hypothetical protein
MEFFLIVGGKIKLHILTLVIRTHTAKSAATCKG